MVKEIKKNLVYLTENLTNVPLVLLYCVQYKIITTDEEERIMARITSLDKNKLFFKLLMKRQWERIKAKIIKIFRKTSNEHCADKIDIPKAQSVDSQDGSTMHEGKIKIISDSKWWPEEKKLPKAFLERKNDNNKLIDILCENLKSSNSRSIIINQEAAVSGLGGVGKTTVAKWFAIQFQNSYDNIIWLNCGDENLQTSFTELAKILKVDTSLELKLMAKESFLKLEETKCLFIFDNAECYKGHQGIRDVLPKHENFHTIITSRTIEWGSESEDEKIPEVHLNVFHIKESVQFLIKSLNDEIYTNKLEELTKMLGNLPLALQMAISSINSEKISMDGYIEKIKQTDNIINLNFDEYEKIINKTIKISLEIIQKNQSNDTQTAYKILIILGYIKSDEVEFELFEAIANLQRFEIEEAMELLEKYSLVTIHSNWNWELKRRMKYCSIHRLLQQVIRHNGKENEKIVLNQILSVEGFIGYKLLPYLHADEETQSLFPKIRAQLVDQRTLEELLEQRKFTEAVELSRKIKDTLKTPMVDYNYAVCLEKMDKFPEVVGVLMLLQDYLRNDTNNCSSTNLVEDLDFDQHFKSAKERIDCNINKNGLWNLAKPIEVELVKGLLFLVYMRQGMNDKASELINQDKQLLTFKTAQSLDYGIKYLKSHSFSDYRLENGDEFIFLKLGNNYGKKISLRECSLSEDMPKDLDLLRLENVEMLDVDGRQLKYYDITPLISNSLTNLFIKCSTESTKFEIQVNKNLRSCDSITLKNCNIHPQNEKPINPTEMDLKTVSVVEKQVEKNYKYNNEDSDLDYDEDDGEDNSQENYDYNDENDNIDYNEEDDEHNPHENNDYNDEDDNLDYNEEDDENNSQENDDYNDEDDNIDYNEEDDEHSPHENDDYNNEDDDDTHSQENYENNGGDYDDDIVHDEDHSEDFVDEEDDDEYNDEGNDFVDDEDDF